MPGKRRKTTQRGLTGKYWENDVKLVQTPSALRLARDIPLQTERGLTGIHAGEAT